MNLDEKYIYVFIRQDMFPDHQMVHTFHLGFLIRAAVEGMCQKRNTVTGHPNVLIFGVANEAALFTVVEKLKQHTIEFIGWIDPDSAPGHDDFGLTGVVTEPLGRAFRNKLNEYRLWSDKKNTHPEVVSASDGTTTV